MVVGDNRLSSYLPDENVDRTQRCFCFWTEKLFSHTPLLLHCRRVRSSSIAVTDIFSRLLAVQHIIAASRAHVYLPPVDDPTVCIFFRRVVGWGGGGHVLSRKTKKAFIIITISLVKVVEKNAPIFWRVRHGGKFVYFPPFFLVNFFRFCTYTNRRITENRGVIDGVFLSFPARRRPPIWSKHNWFRIRFRKRKR